MKRIISSVLLGILLLTLVAVPVLAAYYAYLVVEEEDGNDYEELALTCTRNITQLVQYDLITSTGLDTRVLTGEGSPLPHMLAEDRITFTSDLDAYETKTLIFYCGATSLDNFYIIPGYDGYITTLDDPDLELTYVIELLISGYFDAAVGADKNILYKEDAFKVWISAANTLKVAVLEAGDVEQWSMSYDAFTTGEHTVYVVFDGMQAKLYVDNFITAKDTENLYECANYEISNTKDEWMCLSTYWYPGGYPRTFYDHGMYWAFYSKSGDSTHIYYKTSADAITWGGEYTIDCVVADVLANWSVFLDDNGYLHIAYADYKGNFAIDHVRYRRGDPATNSTITWSAVWQTVVDDADADYWHITRAMVVADPDGYPTVMYYMPFGGVFQAKTFVIRSSTNDGTWTTAGGYPIELEVMGTDPHQQWLIQYPNSNKQYAIWGLASSYVYGRYYNGSTWAGSDDTVSTSVSRARVCGVADNDDNAYVLYGGYGSTEGSDIFLKIRYSDGSWSNEMLVVEEGRNPSISYNPDNNSVYIFYMYWTGSANKLACYFLDIAQSTLVGPFDMFTAPETGQSWGFVSTPYSDHIGILYATYTSASATTTQHAYLWFPSIWNDNANDWTWMENNVMPYGDYFTMAVNGVTQLEYEPSDIIEGTTLPDEESDHDGIITWGSNPLGVTTSLSVFVDEDEAGPPIEGTIPGLTPPPDMVGPTGQPGWTADIPSLVSHPLYPAVNVISDVTGIPSKLIWILGATLLVAAAMLVCFRYAPHQLITVFVGGGLSAFFYSMDIYPFWVIFIFAVMGIAVIIGERSPTVS